MPNHLPLVVETPQANLVAGMKWFLDTYTGRGFRESQLFEIPEGADFLYLGTFDIGHENNAGALSVTVTGKIKVFAGRVTI